MKKLLSSLFFILCLAATTTMVNAQIQTPAASPSAELEQTVGLTDIKISYSRPSMKGRTIYAKDGLVPFGKIWRTGANSVTQISFSDDVKVEGKELKKGKYGITTIPSATSWTVNFFEHDSNNWSSYKEKTPAISVEVNPIQIPVTIETFLIIIGDIKDNVATLEMLWESTLVPVNIEVSYDDKVMAAIDKTLAGPTDGDYYNAGSYMFDTGKDLSKALMYVQKASHADTPRFWQVRKESLILAKMGKKKEAIAAAKKSLALAETAGNLDYVKMNKDSIAEWMKM